VTAESETDDERQRRRKEERGGRIEEDFCTASRDRGTHPTPRSSLLAVRLTKDSSYKRYIIIVDPHAANKVGSHCAAFALVHLAIVADAREIASVM